MRTASMFLRAYAEQVIAYRIVVIIAALAMTVFLVSRVGQLQIDTNPELLVPPNHPYVVTSDLLEQVFGGRNVVVIGVVPKQGDVYQPAVLAKIKRIQEGVEQLPEAIRHNILSLGAHKAKNIRGAADGMIVEPLMETVPQTPEQIAKLKAAVASMPIYINALISPDGKAAAIIADFKGDEQHPNNAAMLKGMHQVVDKERDGTVDIALGGTVIIGETADSYFLKMPTYFGAAFLIIMAIQYWSFRSLQGMLLPMVTGLLSVLWALGFMGLFHVHMDPLNATTPDVTPFSVA